MIQKSFYKTSHRGPDNSIFLNEKTKNNSHRCFGFHRLAINGLSSAGNQPLKLKDCTLVCNGEIYNYRQLIEEFGLKEEYSVGGSDCEIIIHLFRKIGMEETLKRLDGVFAAVLVDHSIEKLYVARDPFGIRSLFYGSTQGFAADITISSEIKSMGHCFHRDVGVNMNWGICPFDLITVRCRFAQCATSVWISILHMTTCLERCKTPKLIFAQTLKFCWSRQ